MTCPVCKSELNQLGHLENGKLNTRIWIPENLYQCPTCQYPNKNYYLDGKRLLPLSPD